MQNGLNENIIERIIGRDRTIGAFVNFSADWIAPGEIMFGSRGAVVLGELNGRMTPRLEELHALMHGLRAERDHHRQRSGAISGASSATARCCSRRRSGRRASPTAWRGPNCCRSGARSAREAVEVALAEGVEPKGFNGFDPLAFMPNAAPERGARRRVAEMVAFNRPNAKTHSGVWRDLAVRKRRTEVDVQIAPIAEIGATPRHRLPRPCERWWRMIHEVEAGKRPMTDDNLLELMRA